jgi:hypothetical protein
MTPAHWRRLHMVLTIFWGRAGPGADRAVVEGLHHVGRDDVVLGEHGQPLRRVAGGPGGRSKHRGERVKFEAIIFVGFCVLIIGGLVAGLVLLAQEGL